MIAMLPNREALQRLARLRVQWRAGSGGAPVGSRRSRRPGSSREFLGLRPYEVGDDVRDLDWAATLRFDRPFLRLYRQEVGSSLLLVIDASASMAYGEPAKLDYALGLACALGHIALAHADRVGALVFNESVVARLPVGRGSGHWRALRDALGGLTAAGTAHFGSVPRWLASLHGFHGLAVILSDFYPPEAFADGLRRLARLPLRAVTLQVLSPQELDPTFDGELELADCETGETRSGWIGPAQRAAYGAALTSLAAQLEGTCRDAGIRYVRASTGVPIVRCLQDSLVRAGVLCRERS